MAVNNYDIAIVGGGLVGSSLALALAARWRVVVLDANPSGPDIPADVIGKGPWDERCIALNDASRRIFREFGVWPLLEPHGVPILSTQISERGRFGVARFTAAEAGLEALGWNIPVRVIGMVLRSRLAATAVDLVTSAVVREVQPGAKRTTLTYECGGEDCSLAASLVVAADGAQSAVRTQLGVAARVRDYHQHAIISAVGIGRPHGGVAYERFTRDGPLAVLPKAADACSMIQTVPTRRLELLMALDDDAYLAQAQALFGSRLGCFLKLGRRVPHELMQVVSHECVRGRVVFVGNAAQSLHPVAAQGFNLGLRDAANLAARLRDADDPGDVTLLEDFAVTRQSDRRRASGFTDLLARAFSSRLPGVVQTRHWGLLGAQLVPPVHRRLLRQHLGHFGWPPER